MFIVFVGPPGAGKGTQSKRLLSYLGIPHLSTGEMLRAAKSLDTSLGKLASQYMDGGRLVPDPLVMDIVGERLAMPEYQSGCLFDGFPRTLSQAKSLDDMLALRQTPLDLVLELRGEESVLINRMLKRAAEEKRVDDNPETIAQRFEVYKRQTFPLLEYYSSKGLLVTIDAMAPPEVVFSNITAAIESHRPSKKACAGGGKAKA